MFSKSVACVLFLLGSIVLALADPVGRYRVSGNNPGGGGNYSGTVSIERTGDTYRVTWDIGRQTFIGTGIGSRDFLAVSYRSGSETGLALYAQQSDGSWRGVWTYAGGRQIGQETWAPR